jgi:hypothetical protein
VTDAEFTPEAILECLERHRVRYVLIGGLAALFYGSPYITTDVDITPERSRANLVRLAAALEELDAMVVVDGLDYPVDREHFPLTAESIDNGTSWRLTTRAGRLDLALMPDGTQGYDDLRRGAQRLPISDRVDVPVAALADIIRSKQAAGREKDLAVLPTLRRALEELSRRDRP